MYYNFLILCTINVTGTAFSFVIVAEMFEWLNADAVGCFFTNKTTMNNQENSSVKCMSFDDVIGPSENLECVAVASCACLDLSVRDGFFQKFPQNCQVQVCIREVHNCALLLILFHK